MMERALSCSISLIIMALGPLVVWGGVQAPVVSLYEFNGTEISLIAAKPNSDLLLEENEVNSTDRYLVLQCKAPYPVQWIYSGDGIPEFIANTSVSWAHDPIEYIASAGIFRLAEYHTGNYTCRSIQNPRLAVSYYLYVTGDNLFTAHGGEAIVLGRFDDQVKIPCSVSNPAVRVTLQKLVDGYVNCPVNDTITYDKKMGFTLKITGDYEPAGDYLCIASYKGKYKFIEYVIIPESSSKVEPSPSAPSVPDDDFDFHIPHSPSSPHLPPSARPSTSPTVLKTTTITPRPTTTTKRPSRNGCETLICGRYAYCQLNSMDEPVCKCEPHFHGDPNIGCVPECVVDQDCPSNRVCNDNACENPCPSICGTATSVQSCKIVDHTAKCEYLHCNPSPCGPHSKCEFLQDRAVCSCLPGFLGNPPYCSRNPAYTTTPIPQIRTTVEEATGVSLKPTMSVPDSPASSGFEEDEEDLLHMTSKLMCRSNRDCEVGMRCISNKCKDPCEPNPCGRSTLCRVSSHEAICSCAPGFIKVNQYCLPTNCRSQRDCPENKACVRNKCINPCAGYCGRNTECTVQLHNPRCECLKGFTGNPFQGCNRLSIKTNIQPIPELLGHKLATPIPTPGVIQPVPSSSKGCGYCGPNAKCVKKSCRCNAGYSGDPSRFCYQIIAIPDSAILNKDESIEAELAFEPESSTVLNAGTRYEYPSIPDLHTKYVSDRVNTKYVSDKLNTNTKYVTSIGDQRVHPDIFTTTRRTTSSTSSRSQTPFTTTNTRFQTALTSTSPKIPTSNTETHYSFSSTLPTIIKKGYDCLKSDDCSVEKSCIANKCLDPCMFFPICGENQECQVLNHKASCVCKKGYPVKIYNNCYPAENYTSLALCNPNPCGPNTDCNITENGAVCRCKPGMIGQPPKCLVDTNPRAKCSESHQCHDLLACINGICSDPCEDSCGYLARCRVYKHQPKCFCPQGFHGNPKVSCSAPLYNSRFTLLDTESRHGGSNLTSIASDDEIRWDESNGSSSSQESESQEDKEAATEAGSAASVTEVNSSIISSEEDEPSVIYVPPATLVKNPTTVLDEEKKRESIARHDDEYFDDSVEMRKLLSYNYNSK